MPFNGIISVQALYPLVFFMRKTSDGTGSTGLSPTVTISKNGGSFGSPAGAVTEIGAGYYKVAANATDSNTAGTLRLTATGTGCYQADESWWINPSGGISVNVDTISDDVIGAGAWQAGAIDAAAIAADALSALANAVVATGLPLVADTQQHAARTLVKGNSYGSASRSFLVTIADGADWPTDLSLWAWTFVADIHPDNTNTGDATVTGTVSVVTPTGASRAVRVSLSSTDTDTLATGLYTYAVRGTQTGGLAWTIELGTLNVLDDPAV